MLGTQALSALVLLFGHDAIVGVYTRDIAVAGLASTLLLYAAAFQFPDGVQVLSAGALRGLNDTRVPMLFAAISFWLVGFTGAYLLAFPRGFGAVGIWIGFSLSVATFAVLLVWRFNALTLEDGRQATKAG